MTIFLVFILTISIVVGIHEFGHYQMARWCNVKVLKFSIGFGRPLFTFFFGKDQTAFVVSSIPLGGYVKLLDESHVYEKENFKKSDLKRAFNRQPLFKRFLIVAAGPLINIILGICIFCFIFMHGSSQIKPLITDVAITSQAHKKGLRAGDEIVSIDNEKIKSLGDLEIYLRSHKQEFKNLNIQREGQLLSLKNFSWDEEIKIFPYGVPILIQSTESGSIAEKIGLKPGDQILTIDQIPVNNIQDLVVNIQSHWLKSYDLSIKRENIIKYIHIDKDIFEGKVEKKRIGVALGYDEVVIKANLVQVKRTFIESMQKSLIQIQSFFYLTLTTFKNLFTHKADLKDLGGPLAIAHMASSSFLEGIFPYIQFIGLISLNIGILNLLPIPLLDGGHLVYYLIEFVRNKPLSDKNMMISQRVGMLILGLLTGIALYNDACRYLLGS
ncbi:RIP metalloprotease RseP [Candidatus Methylopumilus planktonicus]|uniref:RIP metalloprotease RseP n=1 Tax=Candidatus Methylopumilus planktonicus TaxID=1581557 RepID=UPI0011208F34|nr:RIP metalloprotease RseP [Candidatus Methylopumilus planktonicus]QDD06953.1 RIP metalloprotease RseP [Candidatus Methylopumilus planktonicus]QDD08286.1 RIP metalloprotease RseP [Candidatus Methylopumilus planktonicus]QDD09614.1 RIP metalloprotease RseP [Candidatus Methylopumilus planktonicus]